jgi:hypothetical protein
MAAIIRIFVIILITGTAYIQIAAAQGSGECPSIHEKPIAIFIDPTDEEIKRMKIENSEEDFFTISDDNLYYQWQAVEFLKKRNIPYCFTKNESHTFITTTKNRKYVMNKECGYWCLILWNGKIEPVWVNTADIFIYDPYLKK